MQSIEKAIAFSPEIIRIYHFYLIKKLISNNQNMSETWNKKDREKIKQQNKKRQSGKKTGAYRKRQGKRYG